MKFTHKILFCLSAVFLGFWIGAPSIHQVQAQTAWY